MYDEVNHLLAEDFIERSNSEWSSLNFMAKKPNGSYRMGVGYRKINEVFKDDAYPLSFLEDILDRLRPAHYISTIGSSLAYDQVPLEDESRPMTAFPCQGVTFFSSKECRSGWLVHQQPFSDYSIN